ncbi:uncharacterized protein LOC126252082 isoform X2 [Schistocerca nitens]|uniref:uncharacterized protein LOC126252082 isoform X2 n=1 Tax=Schistocerca nitens TaxID=7011 RepID=UPI0021179A11|nr:uncharacterized protein LOC126252082 isoform X2 [Schistocerca nitens]
MLVLYHTLLQAFQYYQTISMGSFSIQKVVYYFKFWQGEIVRVPASGSDKEQILIPLKEFMKKQDELTKKDEMIDALQKKLSHLENLLELKNQRINELSTELQHYQQETEHTA